ncbi:MAG: hypothetical protein OEM28_02500 [Nitrosopumilus sp.]|nr:hypothetical protein [Nitrosopumilus sp.]MDH3486979.1 hypothetical protein [Nitrosopumilus sp.]
MGLMSIPKGFSIRMVVTTASVVPSITETVPSIRDGIIITVTYIDFVGCRVYGKIE